LTNAIQGNRSIGYSSEIFLLSLSASHRTRTVNTALKNITKLKSSNLLT